MQRYRFLLRSRLEGNDRCCTIGGTKRETLNTLIHYIRPEHYSSNCHYSCNDGQAGIRVHTEEGGRGHVARMEEMRNT